MFVISMDLLVPYVLFYLSEKYIETCIYLSSSIFILVACKHDKHILGVLRMTMFSALMLLFTSTFSLYCLILG